MLCNIVVELYNKLRRKKKKNVNNDGKTCSSCAVGCCWSYLPPSTITSTPEYLRTYTRGTTTVLLHLTTVLRTVLLILPACTNENHTLAFLRHRRPTAVSSSLPDCKRCFVVVGRVWVWVWCFLEIWNILEKRSQEKRCPLLAGHVCRPVPAGAGPGTDLPHRPERGSACTMILAVRASLAQWWKPFEIGQTGRFACVQVSQQITGTAGVLVLHDYSSSSSSSSI